MKVVAIIQARMGSSRLPGKVMMQLGGKVVLKRVVDRVAAADGIDAIIVATTNSSQDDVIADFCKLQNFNCYRGEEDDVLERYFQAAKFRKADVIVRITADCPLLDHEVLSDMVKVFKDMRESGENIDYLRNSGFPRGLDVEIFTYQALAKARSATKKDYEREHVTPYFYQHPECFRLADYKSPVDQSNLRWTLDTPEDLAFICKVYAAFSDRDGAFSTSEIHELINRQPAIKMINAHIRQKTLGE